MTLNADGGPAQPGFGVTADTSTAVRPCSECRRHADPEYAMCRGCLRNALTAAFAPTTREAADRTVAFPPAPAAASPVAGIPQSRTSSAVTATG